jgi:Na+/H+ antiporter NhaD/arsenite permease-like protein
LVELVEKALSEALDQCGDAALLLQVVTVIVHRLSNFFNDPSAVSFVTSMALAATAQVVAKEAKAIWKALVAKSRLSGYLSPPPPLPQSWLLNRRWGRRLLPGMVADGSNY